MKTIKQAALSYAANYKNITKSLYTTFIEGAEYSQRWIPVEEELPENQDIVLLKTDKDCYLIGYFHGSKSGFIYSGEDHYKDLGEITHWRPIEHK